MTFEEEKLGVKNESCRNGCKRLRELQKAEKAAGSMAGGEISSKTGDRREINVEMTKMWHRVMVFEAEEVKAVSAYVIIEKKPPRRKTDAKA